MTGIELDEEVLEKALALVLVVGEVAGIAVEGGVEAWVAAGIAAVAGIGAVAGTAVALEQHQHQHQHQHHSPAALPSSVLALSSLS